MSPETRQGDLKIARGIVANPTVISPGMAIVLARRLIDEAEQRDALLSFAESQEAIDLYDTSGNGYTRLELEAVLVRHGFTPPIVTHRQTVDFVRSLRDAALAKVRG